MLTLTHTAVMMHGIECRDGDGLCWHQYWRGVEHTWCWCGIPVAWRMRKRDRPMHMFIRMATSSM